jgi:probable F420-dependent oxidoreductase
MDPVRVGVQLAPQHTDIGSLRSAWRRAEDLGVDSIWIWDHFFPIDGDPGGTHFECWSLLAALAADTTTPTVGPLVTCSGYRNPDLIADMARTLNALSGARFILGIGAGWSERDCTEYGYGELPGIRHRLDVLEDSLKRIRDRLRLLNPPAPQLPLLVGGAGEKVTLRLVAQYADMWNAFGSPDEYANKSAALDDWCSRVGRDPATIERTVLINTTVLDNVAAYVAAGAQHVIASCRAPFDLDPVAHLVRRFT